LELEKPQLSVSKYFTEVNLLFNDQTFFFQYKHKIQVRNTKSNFCRENFKIVLFRGTGAAKA